MYYKKIKNLHYFKNCFGKKQFSLIHKFINIDLYNRQIMTCSQQAIIRLFLQCHSK